MLLRFAKGHKALLKPEVLQMKQSQPEPRRHMPKLEHNRKGLPSRRRQLACRAAWRGLLLDPHSRGSPASMKLMLTP